MKHIKRGIPEQTIFCKLKISFVKISIKSQNNISLLKTLFEQIYLQN